MRPRRKGAGHRKKVILNQIEERSRWLDGSWRTLGIYLLFCSLVAVSLAATVNRRSDASLQSSFGGSRWKDVITFWSENGYFRHAGLIFYTNKPIWYPDNPAAKGTFCYSASTGGFLIAANALETIAILTTGSYSYHLIAHHNEAILLLASALVGFLALKLSSGLGCAPRHSLVLGLGCALIFQTFPFNLATYWETTAQFVAQLFMIVFLLLMEQTLFRSRLSRSAYVTTFLVVFFMCYSEMIVSFFCLATFVVIILVLGRGAVRWKRIILTLVAPAGLSLLTFAVQLAWVKFVLHAPMIGHGIMYRTGFDGSIQYVGDHWSLIRKRIGPLAMDWKWLFIAGSVAVVFILIQFARNPRYRRSVMIVTCALGSFVPMAFFFSQMAVIHPYYFDTFLVLPLVLCLFALAPATMEIWSGNKGIFTLVSIGMAFCYAMVQIRTYAIMFP
jgi:hypothetical protein